MDYGSRQDRSPGRRDDGLAALAMFKGSLNVKAAFLHNLTDAAASLAVLVGWATIFWLD